MSDAADIYCAHFGLRERPFLTAPDPAFLFWSRAHRAAFTVLDYGLVSRAPITLLTGEVGAGKTTLLRHLLSRIGEDLCVGLVSNAQGGRDELLRWTMHAFGQPAEPGEDHVALFARLQDFLVGQYAAGRRAILVFDEAQHLSPGALEELRMYTNVNIGKDEILQLILVGQPELREGVRRPDLRQFAQRIAVSYHLPSLGATETLGYVAHRLEAAGGSAGLLSPEACALIHDRTGGVPRLVNQLCDLSLLYAFTEGAAGVTRATVSQILADGVFFGAVPARRDPLRLVDGAAPLGEIPDV